MLFTGVRVGELATLKMFDFLPGNKLRKTYCSELLDLGISEKIVQNQMRHADIATTKGHYYFSTKKDDAIREALNRNNKLCVNI